MTEMRQRHCLIEGCYTALRLKAQLQICVFGLAADMTETPTRRRTISDALFRKRFSDNGLWNVYMRPPHVVWHNASVLFVCLSVLTPESLLTRYIEQHSTVFHQTYNIRP